MNRLLLVTLMLVFVGCASSSTLGPLTEREAVAAAISGREFDPDAPPELTLAPESAATLLSLARNPGEHPMYVAHRATSLLRHHPTRAVYEGLVALAESGDGGTREAALSSLGHAFSRAHPHELADLGARKLNDDDAGVRRAARELVTRARASRFALD
jgi:HEAT repeat protein